MRRSVWFSVLVVFFLGFSTFSNAASLQSAKAPFSEAKSEFSLLVRSGHNKRELSLAEIESLKHYEITMNAPGGVNGKFSGVLLADLIKYLKFDPSKRLYLRAVDDYKITLQPQKELGFDQILFVTRLDGHVISLINKGPFKIIWAHNANEVESGLASSVKWIWSIVEIREIP